MVTVGNKLLLFGGYDGSRRFNDLWYLDTAPAATGFYQESVGATNTQTDAVRAVQQLKNVRRICYYSLFWTHFSIVVCVSVAHALMCR